jgi:hypothetical protein
LLDAGLHDWAQEGAVAEVFVEFTEAVCSEEKRDYVARACGAEMPDGRWQGWIEFVPVGGGQPIRSSRETTQPNRQDTLYWATGLTAVYLEGALRRSRNRPVRPIARDIAPPHFDGPAENFVIQPAPAESVLDPFSVYRKGEDLLRRQLSALAVWHLVNIIRDYHLSREKPAELSTREPAQLAELIIDAVRNPQAIG